MKSSKLVTAVIPAMVLVSGCATLENTFQESPLAGAFTQVDEDGDGVISEGEAAASESLAANFDTIDTNRSGGIDGNEYASAAAHIAPLDFAFVDINGDGVISEREAAAMPVSLRESFGDVDSDGDANVSSVEYEAASVNLLDGAGFGSVDKDGDGVIGSVEAQGVPALAEAFDRIDADADGLVSEEEFERAQTTQ